MAAYHDDRAFTNHVHTTIAQQKIYEPLQWVEVALDLSTAGHIDLHRGIDYLFEKEGVLKTVQERFREKKYQAFTDFTIRYRRDSNVHQERKESEYFKMKAAFFTYGITNGDKAALHSCTDFIKYAVIDLKKVYAKIDDGLICIQDNGELRCVIDEKKMICPVKYNADRSSSFFPIDIRLLAHLWKNELIISQKGFL